MDSALPDDSEPETAANPGGGGATARGGRALAWVLGVGTLVLAGGLVTFQQLASSPGKPEKTAAPVAVQAAHVELGTLDVEREYPGELVAEAADLAAEVSARVESVEVQLGDRVERGAVLVRLDAELLAKERAQARAQARADKAAVDGAEARRTAARRELKRGEALRASSVVSEAELDALRSAVEEAEAEASAARARSDSARARAALLEAQIDHASIKAPYDGVVAQRWIDPGAYLRTGDPVLRLVRTEGLRVEFKIPEGDIGLVDVGDPLSFDARGLEGQTFHGAVARTSGEVSSSDRSLLVEARLDETGQLPAALKPGMYAQVHVVVERLAGATIVPAAAVVERISADGARRTGVYVLREDRAHFVDVELRGRSGERAAVEGALSVRDLVLVRGHRELSDATAVRLEGEVLGQPTAGSGGASKGGAAP